MAIRRFFLKALEYVTDGLLSDNITEEIGFNTIRKMMGKKTIRESEKESNKHVK